MAMNGVKDTLTILQIRLLCHLGVHFYFFLDNLEYTFHVAVKFKHESAHT